MVRSIPTALAAISLVCGAASARAQAPAAEFRFTAETPAVGWTVRPDGYIELRLEGHRTGEGAPGAPDLPVRTVLVAIPPESTPRLEFHVTGEIERRSGTPQPVPHVVSDDGLRQLEYEDLAAAAKAATATDPVLSYQPDPRLYHGAATHPERVAWLGKVGVLRDQRYVAVHIAPVRFEPKSQQLLVARTVELTVHFDGPRGGAPAEPDPRFEPVYRKSFLNYEQGRAFRIEGGPALAGATAAGAVTTPRRRIVVRQDGVVRLDHAFVLAQAPEFLAYTPLRWRLSSRGVQVPLQIRQLPGDNNVLEAGEWVAFYGQKLDEEPKTVLFADNGGNEDLYEVRDFSDESVYFLTIEPGTQPQMATREAAPAAGTPPTFFNATAHVEIDDLYLPFGGEDPWFSLPGVTEFDPERIDSVPLPGLQSQTAPATFRVRVRGASGCRAVDPDHITRVSVRNASSQTLKLPVDPDNQGNQNVGQFDDRTWFLHDFSWTHSALQPQLTSPLSVVIEVDDIVGCANDVVVDWVEVDYRRAFTASGDVLTFEYPNGTADFAVSGLNGPLTNIHVYEVTKQIASSGVVDAVRLTGVTATFNNPTYTARFRMDLDGSMAVGAPRRFAVVGANGAASVLPADFARDRVSELMQDLTPADLIVVAHPSLLDSQCSEGANPCNYDVDCTASDSDRCEVDPSSELGLYLAHRQGQGISARVVRVGDVADEFNDGLAGPVGIRNFMEWTVGGGWSGQPPSYLLLLGDGSYDFKGGTASGNYVPTPMIVKANETLGFFSADNVLGAVVGDDALPEVVVGRIAARTLAEAEGVFEKIRTYELFSAGAWRGHSLFISDRGKDCAQFEAQEYERINKIAVDWVEATDGYTLENLRYWTDYCMAACNCDTEGMRDAIQDAVNGVSGPGAALLQYIGHGNFILWSDDVLFCVDASSPFCDADDMQTLFNAPAFPWVLAHNCLTGGFHHTSPLALGELWLEREVGGAIAVLAPSGLGFRFLGENVVNEIWPDLFGPAKERAIAVPLMDSLVELCSTSGTPEGCMFYTLLGDPSLTLALPQVDPATAVEADPGNAVVHLSWTASGDAVSYDVWRAVALTNGYIKVNPAPIAGTAYSDTTVLNGTTYYYYVVARDADGFESAWSNTNTDCATLGPDCVTARPLNPNPPASPTGVVVSDPETGGRLDVSWSPNAETDFEFYRVLWGTTPALGQSFLSFDTSASITGLIDGQAYYVAVDATNTSDLTSPPSAPPVLGVPTKVLGLKAPGLIGDLRVGKSGDDAVLLWSDVTTDIYGKPKVIVSYDVFRASTPAFVPDVIGLSNRIGTSASAGYLDDGALAAPGPMYYLVRGIDGDGTGGGLGRQLPDGIDDLLVTDGPVANLTLSWSPVTTDFDHHPTTISHYVLYGSSQPFSRADIRDGTVPVLVGSIPGTTVQVPRPPDARYYSVLAVDTRGNPSPY